MTARVEIVPATERDFLDYTARYSEGPMLPPVRVVALAARLEGTTIGLGGIAFMKNGVKLAFADISDEARKFPVSIHKTGLAVIALARKHNIKRIIATSTTVENGGRWLLRLGFRKEEASEGVAYYVYDL